MWDVMPDHDSTEHRWERSILETLAETNQATTTELAKALDEHPMTVERQCRILQRDGYICRGTAGTYTLADDGEWRSRTDATLAD